MRERHTEKQKTQTERNIRMIHRYEDRVFNRRKLDQIQSKRAARVHIDPLNPDRVGKDVACVWEKRDTKKTQKGKVWPETGRNLCVWEGRKTY